MKATISRLNIEIFGEIDTSAQDNIDAIEDGATDEMENLLQGLALGDDEVPPTVDRPSPQRDLSDSEADPLSRASSPLAALSRSPSPDPPKTAKVAARSSGRRAAETANVPLATPPVPKPAGKAKKSKLVAVSEQTLSDMVPVQASKRKKPAGR